MEQIEKSLSSLESESPLVSVLLACYNHAAYVEQAVRSVMAQKGVSFELIVIDDGSSDESPLILQKLSQEFHFDLTCRENLGVTQTLNEMLAKARGKYFCSFASDDIMPESRLLKQSQYLETHPEAPACFGQIILMDSFGTRAASPDARYLRSIPQVTFEEFFLGKKELHGCSEMIRVSLFREMGGYNAAFLTEDFSMFLSLLYKYKTLPVTADICCYYRRHDDNLSDKTEIIYSTFLQVVEQYQAHPLYAQAKKIWKAHWFSALAYSNKREALRRLTELFSFSSAFLKRFPKLFIPRRFLKG